MQHVMHTTSCKELAGWKNRNHIGILLVMVSAYSCILCSILVKSNLTIDHNIYVIYIATRISYMFVRIDGRAEGIEHNSVLQRYL